MTRHRVLRLALAVVPLAAAVSAASALPAPTAEAAGGGYVALPPARVLDTREGLGAPARPVGPGATIDVAVTGVGGVPSDGVAAVVLNLTGTNPTAATVVSAYPAGGRREGSNLNLLAGQTAANLVVAAVGADGKVSLYNAFGTVDLVADVAGWFPTGDTYQALTPARILDTREGLGAPRRPVAQGASLNLDVTGVGGVPATGVAAVVLNLTGTQPTAATFITAYPTGSVRAGSNLNLLPGQTDASLVIATVGAGGQVSLYNAFGTTELVADVAGWFPSGSDYHALTQYRILDTREGLGAARAPVGAGAEIEVDVTGVGGVPADGVGAVVLNVTATSPTANTFVTAYPTGGTREGSNVNLLAGETTSNLVIAKVGTGGTVSLYNAFGTIDLIADVAGWFPVTEPPEPPLPDLGTMWAQGNSSLYSYQVNSGAPRWTDHGLWYEEFTVVPEQREFVLATEDIQTSPYSIRIDVRDLDTMAIEDTFVWDTQGWWDVYEFIASSDGRWFVGLFGDIVPTALEIYDRQSGDFYVFDARDDTQFTSIAFTPDNDLVVVHDLRDLGGEAAAVMYVLHEDDFADDPWENLTGLAGFELTVPYDVEVSPDGSQVLFSDNRQLFVMALEPDAEPQLVASAPAEIAGAQFSPDGSMIVAVRDSISRLFQTQYVFPNDPAHPVTLDDTNGAPYLLIDDDNLIEEIIAWER